MYHIYMRIWLLTENWPPRVGGIERYLTGIAGHLDGHEVTVIAPFDSPANSGIAQGKPLEVRVLRKRFFWPMWPKWLPLYFALKKMATTEKPDVIICGKALVEGRIAKMLKKSLGIPYIICTYGMEIATWEQLPRTRKQLQRVLHHAGAVIYINKQTKQELLALGVPEHNLHELYPGIDSEKLSHMNASEDVLKKFNIVKPFILSVSRLVKRKGTSDLLEAFAKLEEENLQLVIVGDGPERNSLEKQAKMLGIDAVFLGTVSDDDLHALYSRATLFALTPKALPGDYEGFGIVYLEAGFFGLPVIGTKTGGVGEAIQDGITGITAEAGNIASIQDALHKLLTVPTLATQYGKQGNQRVMDEFLWEQTIAKLTNILERSSL